MEFEDHFSRQAAIYSKARPTYPDELFEFLVSVCANKDVCWDCATGNGQAAISLSPFFKKIIATDGSEEQIKVAVPKDNIEYRVATAEESGLPDKSVDLITVATAAHWFNHEMFYKEAERVTKPGGTLAVWTYSSASINAEIDELMQWFMYDFLEAYWPDGRWYVRKKYETLPFPFEQIETPQFFCKMNWTKEQWVGYVKSWSAYNKYEQMHGSEPLQFLMPKLNLLWNNTDIREVVWPLHLKCAVLNK